MEAWGSLALARVPRILRHKAHIPSILCVSSHLHCLIHSHISLSPCPPEGGPTLFLWMTEDWVSGPPGNLVFLFCHQPVLSTESPHLSLCCLTAIARPSSGRFSITLRSHISSFKKNFPDFSSEAKSLLNEMLLEMEK